MPGAATHLPIFFTSHNSRLLLLLLLFTLLFPLFFLSLYLHTQLFLFSAFAGFSPSFSPYFPRSRSFSNPRLKLSEAYQRVTHEGTKKFLPLDSREKCRKKLHTCSDARETKTSLSPLTFARFLSWKDFRRRLFRLFGDEKPFQCVAEMKPSTGTCAVQLAAKLFRRASTPGKLHNVYTQNSDGRRGESGEERRIIVK
jgi:hypothetical protein